jgi:hypothetical protein
MNGKSKSITVARQIHERRVGRLRSDAPAREQQVDFDENGPFVVIVMRAGSEILGW